MSEFVVPHDPNWQTSFQTEARAISSAMGGLAIRLHHIGSTAIPDILAKPIIDMLGVVPDISMLDDKGDAFAALSYQVMGAFGIDGRRYFRKFAPSGRRMFHLHVFGEGSAHIERHLAFRDYLRCHPERAAEYSALKSRLTSESEIDWDRYMDGKDPFVTSTEAEALVWYRRTKGGEPV